MTNELESFLSYLKSEHHYSNDTISAYQLDIEKFYSYLNKQGILFEQINEIIVKEYFLFLQNKKVSNSSLSRYKSSLKNYCDYLLKNEILSHNPFFDCQKIIVNQQFPQYLSKENIDIIINSFNLRSDNYKIRDEAIVKTIYYCGLTAKEIVDLTFDNIDIHGQTIRLFNNNKERIMHLNKDVLEIISSYLKITRIQLLKKNLMRAKQRHIFLNSYGEKLTVRGLEAIFDSIAKKGKFNFDFTPRILRGTFISHSLANGIDLAYLQEITGIKSVVTLYKYYPEQ